MGRKKSILVLPNDYSKEIEHFNELLELRQAGVAVEKGVTLSDGTMLHNPVTRKVISADKWKTRQIKRATDAADDWLDGVKNPSRDPIEAAIAAEAKMAERTLSALKEHRQVAGLKKVPKGEIAEVATKLGSGVFSAGIAARDAKIGRTVNELQPLVQATSDAIQAMPDGTDAEREKRLLSARRLMIEVGKKRRGV